MNTETDIITRFGKKLRSLRKELGLTQAEIAEKLDVSEGAYGNWERGQRGPDISNLPKIAGFFKVSIDSLFEYSSEYHFPSMLGLSWSLTRSPTDKENVALSIWNQLAGGKSFASVEPPIETAIAERYLKDIFYTNLIDIKKVPNNDELEKRIRKQFGIRDVKVVNAGQKKQEQEQQNNVDALFRKILVAEAARDHYKQDISQSDVYKTLKIGLSGGSTVSHFVHSLKRGEVSHVEFYPLANSTGIHTTPIDANSLVGVLAFRHHGYNVIAYTLHYTSKKDREMADSQSIQAAGTRFVLRRGEGVDVVFMGLGSVERVREHYDMLENILVEEGLTTEKMKEEGAVGDILFHFVNRNGEVMYPQINELICALAPSALQALVKDNIPVIVLATEEKKKEIVWVAIKHKYVNELIIDDELASALLEMEDTKR